MKLKGLGRGLDALLAANQDIEKVGESLQNLPLSLLQPGKYQPRTRMDQQSLAELAESIKSRGVMQPILVRPVSAGRYEIIAGERRWRAAQLAGLPDLNPLEEAAGIQRLIMEFGMTHQEASQALGSSRSAVSNLLRLLNLPAPVQELLMQGKIDMGHGRALLSLSPAKQIEIANVVAHKQLSVRETERLVHRLEHQKEKAHPRPDRDLMRLQENISAKLGAEVTIKSGKNGKGSIVIHYHTLEQLDGILSRW
jgi:ParB family chromosome partitioning protein